ncbi:exosortase family protein XrtF [Flavobacterium azooxidireducens]|uniref:Exosortase family protein XrtF n=1 Tax=Flavobacterium azooxidireducens TaxID=1871076 RepID=A0ABY4KGF8_9FLAO|nr:exosortase family protein XrtF [Flavobacterium azooxidireducens]UPQ79896.1 exosortase family protein XrtF [Flavobacterium azooxidireducens]
MKKYIIQYKPFLIFLLKFFLSYLILTFLYQFYLNSFDSSSLEVDSITQLVSVQTQQTIELFQYNSYLEPHPKQNSTMLFVEGKNVARVVEGCNAISVIILFIAFVIAFKGNWKKTVLFILAGSILIYVLNIIRIALIAIALYHYPQHEHLLHGVIFPLFIYGVVFLLWVIWVNKFSVYAIQKKA